MQNNLLEIPSTLGFKREARTNSVHSVVEKKRKLTTMSESAEQRLSKATEFVTKDISEHKVGLHIAASIVIISAAAVAGVIVTKKYYQRSSCSLRSLSPCILF